MTSTKYPHLFAPLDLGFTSLPILACLLCQANASFAAPPDVVAHKLATTPVIDGIVVGNDAWIGVVPATGFRQVQPNDGQPSSQKTEVFIGYSNTSLFIGVIAHDDDPAGIICSECSDKKYHRSILEYLD